MQIMGTVTRNLVRMDVKPYSLDLVKGLERYFDSPEYSDVTIRYRSRDFHAHRVVLASQSPYFADALPSEEEDDDDCEQPALTLHNGGPVLGHSEARRRSTPGTQQILDMHDESPRVVEAVLCFLYHADYRDSSSPPPPSHPDDHHNTPPISFNLLVYAAAERFRVASLKRCARLKMQAAAEAGWDSDEFVRAVGLAYGGEVEGVDDGVCGGVLVDVAARHAEELGARKAFRGAVEEFERFGAEVAAAVARRAAEVREASVPCIYCGLGGEGCRCWRIWSG